MSRRAFVPDAEFLDAAIGEVIRTYPPSLMTVDESGHAYRFHQPDHAIAYASTEQFRRENKACCAFVQRGAEGYEPSWLSWLLGYEWKIVRVQYKVRFRDDAGNLVEKPSEAFVVLRRDGKVFKPR